MTSRKLVITKEGYNAITETDPNNKTFDSDYDTLKYFAYADGYLVTGSISPHATYEGRLRIRHNLGYIPFFNVLVQQTAPSTGYVYPTALVPVAGWGNISAYATDTDIFLYAHVHEESTQAGDTPGTIASATYRVIVYIYRNNLDI